MYNKSGIPHWNLTSKLLTFKSFPDENLQTLKSTLFLHLNILLFWQDFMYYQSRTYLRVSKLHYSFLSKFRFFGSSPLWNPICIQRRIKLVNLIRTFLNFRFHDLIFDLTLGFEVILNVRFELKRKFEMAKIQFGSP